MATVRYNCPHCAANRVAFEVVAANEMKSCVWTILAICGACRLPVCGVASNPSTTGSPIGVKYALNGSDSPWTVSALWPSHAQRDAPQHTPPAVARRFLEGEAAFERQSWNAAVAMYRSALDIATKQVDGVPKGSFFNRLQWLHEQHRITPDMKDWADHVRVEGNEALHDPEEFVEGDARPLRLFTEMFLRYMFELPGEVTAFRAKTDATLSVAAQ